jgi:protein-disulfide isomerase
MSANVAAAATSATSASTSATAAATSATSAAASATAAATSATSAAASATAATTSAASAVTSATSAASSASDAATTYDNFDDRYLGAKSTAPSVDNDGNSLLTGALYFNSVTGIMGVWSGSAWVAINTTSSYSAPTLGSTLLPSGTTVTTIAGLTLTAPTLTGTVTASGDINLSAAGGPGSLIDELTLLLMEAL